MENREIPPTTPLPSIIKIIGDGCNQVANRVYLLVIPAILDLFLLFGPKLRVDKYLMPFVNSAIQQMRSASPNTGARQLETIGAIFSEALSTVNLFGFVQTYPIGISVMMGSSGAATPLGYSAEVQLSNALTILAVIVMMVIIGILLGTIYHAVIALAVTKKKFDLKAFLLQLLNVVLLYLALIVILALFSVPYSCIMTAIIMLAPVLYQFFMLLIIVLACWLIIPLFYIPHGIFVKNLDFPHAVKESFKLSSWSSSITVRFILLSLVLSLGLNIIWTIPEQSSWLIIISIFGHAFVSTALLASSFILYREIYKWQNENRSFLEWRKANVRFIKIIKKEPENHD